MGYLWIGPPLVKSWPILVSGVCGFVVITNGGASCIGAARPGFRREIASETLGILLDRPLSPLVLSGRILVSRLRGIVAITNRGVFCVVGALQHGAPAG